jgi:hypothetical protein
MDLGSPFDALHSAMASAMHRDFASIEYEDRDWTEYSKMTREQQAEARKSGTMAPTIKKIRRPNPWDLEVIMFAQGWGSTALGYGGIGGQATTSAYTVIVNCRNEYCVYFGSGGRLAYKIDAAKLTSKGRETLMNDIHSHNMPDCREFVGRYERKEI